MAPSSWRPEARPRLGVAAAAGAAPAGRHRARCAAAGGCRRDARCAPRIAARARQAPRPRPRPRSPARPRATATNLRDAFILSADTVVVAGGRILPKAEVVDEAAACLRLLSGRAHRVYTSICLVTPKDASASGSSRRGCASSACRATSSTATSPPANGAARPAATPSRALPAPSW